LEMATAAEAAADEAEEEAKAQTNAWYHKPRLPSRNLLGATTRIT
jgi:hypothetical protein